MSENILEVASLRKTFSVRSPAGGYEDFPAVDNISFSLPRGGSLSVVGESGSGKTTTARIVAGLETRSGGEILFDGQPLDSRRGIRHRRERARRIQMVFQDPFASLDPRQTLGSALDEVLAVNFDKPRAWRRERIAVLLEQVGLDPKYRDSAPGRLSGGQRQRFAIARSLALEPSLLILDEAVSALDVSVQAQVLNLLIDIRQQTGISYLFVSHDLAVVRQVSDSCLVLKSGRIVEHGPTESVLNSPQDPYTRALLDAVPRPGWKPTRSVRA